MDEKETERLLARVRKAIKECNQQIVRFRQLRDELHRTIATVPTDRPAKKPKQPKAARVLHNER